MKHIDLGDHPVHSQDQQHQAVAPVCPQPPQWLKLQDADLQAFREELQACRMAIQAEAQERSNAVALVERTCKAFILVEKEERTASIGALHADLRVTDAKLHELFSAHQKQQKDGTWQSVSIDPSPSHQAKISLPTQEQMASTQEVEGPAITTPVATADMEADVEAEIGENHQVLGSEEIEFVKVPKMPSSEPSPAAMRSELLDELATIVAQRHGDLLDDLKWTLNAQLRDVHQGLWHTSEHEMPACLQFENCNMHAFEMLKLSLGEVQDLAKRARERAQNAREQLASASMTTPSPAEMAAQAAQATRTAADASCTDDRESAVPLPGSGHVEQPAQAHLQESVRRPPQELVIVEDTHACGGADRAAGPRHPLGAEEAPDAPGPLDADRKLRNTLLSNITARLHGPVLSETDLSILAQSGDLASGQGQAPSRYLLRCSSRDRPEVTTTTESSC